MVYVNFELANIVMNRLEDFNIRALRLIVI